jgi:hypothetical protein
VKQIAFGAPTQQLNGRSSDERMCGHVPGVGSLYL